MALEAFREKYPEYNEVPDNELADQLYDKYYTGMDRAEFDQSIGMAQAREPSLADSQVGLIPKVGAMVIDKVTGALEPGAETTDPSLSGAAIRQFAGGAAVELPKMAGGAMENIALGEASDRALSAEQEAAAEYQRIQPKQQPDSQNWMEALNRVSEETSQKFSNLLKGYGAKPTQESVLKAVKTHKKIRKSLRDSLKALGRAGYIDKLTGMDADELAVNTLMETGTSLQEWAEDTEKKYPQLGPDPEFGKRTVFENFMMDPVRTTVTLGARNLPNMLASMVAYGAFRLGGGAATSIGLEMGDQFTDGKQFLIDKYQGAENVPMEEWANLTKTANTVGMVAGAFDILPIANLFKKAGMGDEFAKNFWQAAWNASKQGAATGLQEMGTEAIQEMVQVAGSETVGQDKTLSEKFNQVFAGMIAGAGTGTVTGTVAGAARQQIQPPELPPMTPEDVVEITPDLPESTSEQEKADVQTQPETSPERPAKGDKAAQEEIAEQANEAATSPENDLPQPTEAQKEAGNYKKAHIKVSGLDIAIENPRGSERTGTDQDGETWSVKMRHHYGYLKRSESADGEQVDVFVGPRAGQELPVFVIDQVDPKTGKFDEAKVMLGFPDEQTARKGYLQNYEKGWQGLGKITQMSMDEFKTWLKKDTTKPADKAAEAVTTEVAKTIKKQERRVKKEAGPRERREDVTTRKKIDELTLEEAREELRVSRLTPLSSERVYDERKRKKYQSSFDVDNFKQVNDKYSQLGGDQIITFIGKTFKEEADKSKVDAYNFHGDEFLIEADDHELLKNVSETIRKRLDQAEVTVRHVDGRQLTKRGVRISYGTGKTRAEAETNLSADKERRRRAGLRTKRERESDVVAPETTTQDTDRRGKTAEVTEKPVKSEVTAEPTEKAAKQKVSKKETEIAPRDVLGEIDQILEGKEPSNLDLNGNPIPPDLMIEMQVDLVDSGETGTDVFNAADLMAELREKQAAYKALQDCL